MILSGAVQGSDNHHGEYTGKSRLRVWLHQKMGSKYGLLFLSVLTFFESAFFPVPPDFFIVPMVMSKPSIWKKVALWVTISSVLGAMLGYGIGTWFYHSIGQAIVDANGLQNEMMFISSVYDKNVFWAVLLAAFTPIPFKLFTIAAGVAQVHLLPFVLAAIIGRGARYTLVPYLAAVGAKSTLWQYLRNHKAISWATGIGFVLVIIYYFFVKL